MRNAEFKGTVVAVTHDRYFLDNVAGWILELDRGQGIPFEGNYSEWLKAKSKRLEVLIFWPSQLAYINHNINCSTLC